MVTVSVLAHKRGECYTLSTVNQSGFPDDEEEKEEAANGAAAAADDDDDDDDADAASAAGLRVKFEAYIIYKFHPKYILEKRIPQTAYILSISGALGDTGVHRHKTEPIFIQDRT